MHISISLSMIIFLKPYVFWLVNPSNLQIVIVEYFSMYDVKIKINLI